MTPSSILRQKRKIQSIQAQLRLWRITENTRISSEDIVAHIGQLEAISDLTSCPKVSKKAIKLVKVLDRIIQHRYGRSYISANYRTARTREESSELLNDRRGVDECSRRTKPKNREKT